MNVRKDKGHLPDLRIGDLVEITVNDQNLLVDVHKAGEISHHRIVRGQLAVTLGTGHETAVIRTAEGKEESHGIRPVARSKVSSLPVGAEVTFLLDELDTIVDVTLGTPHRDGQSTTQGHKQSPIKGNLRQVPGVILKALQDKTIAIRTEDGKEQSFEVRPLILDDSARSLAANLPSYSSTKHSKWRMSPSTTRTKGVPRLINGLINAGTMPPRTFW